MATITEKPLGQVRENSTTAVSVYSPPASTIAIIKSITVCNTSGDAATFRIFLDNDGSTTDESTAKYWDEPLPTNTTFQIDTYWVMDNSSGNLAYQNDPANSITITAHGAEIT